MWQYRYMLRKIFTYVILILTLIPNTLGEVLADDELSLHSLADLPYRASETFDSRRTLLEDDRTMQIPSEEDSFDPSVTLSEASDTLRMPINFDAANELDSSFMTVLAEKRVFEKKQEMLVPTFLTNPFMTDFSKDTTLLDLFLSS